GGVELDVLKKEPHRSRHLAHPFQTAIVASMQEIINQRLEYPRRGEQGGDLSVDAGFVREDLCFDADEHRSTEKANTLRTL
ncbi:hypothetical protein M3583_23380, partial [Bacillus subtilis]|nr:hypothetical protein [Bacillus subtilis]